MTNYYKLVDWADVAEMCDYPEEDNNDGYVFGLEFLDENKHIVDVEWFKTKEGRNYAVNELLKDGYRRF